MNYELNHDTNTQGFMGVKNALYLRLDLSLYIPAVFGQTCLDLII